MTKRTILFLLCGALSFTGCGDDDGTTDTGPGGDTGTDDTGTDDTGPIFDGGPDFDGGPPPTDAGPPPDPTCENLCTLAMTNCAGDPAAYTSMAECMTFCEDIGAWEVGTTGTAGNTIACRIDALQTSDCNAGGFTGGGVCGSYCENLCNNLENTCTGSDAVFENQAACNAACADFNQAGIPGTTSGDTVQCRIYHGGIPANMSPATHCPHTAVISGDNVCGTDTMDFDFRMDDPDTYTRVDRVGMPAVSTALVTGDADKAAYNDASPSDDAMLTFAGELITNLTGLHTALDPEIEDAAGLTPCSMDPSDPADPMSLPGCLAQEVAPGVSVVSLVVPDVLTLDTGAAAGFPNGRLLTDPVIDVTLAIVLLDLTTNTPADLVGVLNPDANDVAFRDAFPYLAEAQ